ncbi:MAG: STAS domain-containing protein [Roseiarcus sp.]|jgi:chemotaxis protein CheX
MAKESVWQRRARKCRSAKAEYYPKVNLAELASEAEQASPQPESLDLPAATRLAAAQTTSEPEGALRLPDCLDLLAATPLARALLERRGAPIVLDGSSVHQLGAQCVQVLLSAKRTWDADGIALSIVNCAPRMIEDLQLLGIDSATLTSGEQPQ